MSHLFEQDSTHCNSVNQRRYAQRSFQARRDNATVIDGVIALSSHGRHVPAAALSRIASTLTLADARARARAGRNFAAHYRRG